ncbi:MAG: bifunctional hydroxymethylpyrimidine kinase/phosphomethylpyrimidine kinase [Oscillospiraceae bacterium]|nr:bifunctional hydroxymethylpyrimidine kinase/phosphomethylpyrimidine kinase [Oscillospiraceae bacterium]
MATDIEKLVRDAVSEIVRSQSEPTKQKKHIEYISLEDAKLLADKVEKRAREMGVNAVVAIADEGGYLNDNSVIDTLLFELLKVATPHDIVVFAGSLPKGADENTYKIWINQFAQKGIKVFFDADKNALKSGIESKPYFIKPNLDELSRLLNKNFIDMADIKANAQHILKSGVKKIAVTMGESGSLLVSEDGAYYAKPLKVDVKSTVGAGDSFLAAVALCEQMGKSDADTLKYAAAVSSAKVMCEGNLAPDKKLIESLLLKIEIEEI